MGSNISQALKVWLLTIAVLAVFSGSLYASETKVSGAVERIGPEEAREMVTSGEALLVCSYSDQRCKSLLLEGALLRSELDDRLKDLPMDQPLIFYCG